MSEKKEKKRRGKKAKGKKKNVHRRIEPGKKKITYKKRKEKKRSMGVGEMNPGPSVSDTVNG